MMVRKIILMGLPTSGKTKTAGILSQALKLGWVDTDLMIEEKFGHSIPWIFKNLGEPGFRALEHQVMSEAIAGSAEIISLGGGAVTYPPTAALLQGHTVYYLKASPEFLSRRLRHHQLGHPQHGRQGTPERPLLAGDAAQRLQELYAERREIYDRLATVVIDAEKKRSEMAADIVAAEQRAASEISVEGSRPYRVMLGTDLAAGVMSLLPEDVGKILILAAPPVVGIAEELGSGLRQNSGVETRIMTLPDGEACKQLAVLSSVWQEAAEFGLERRDAIIPVGGGATTDLGGFAAATWLRGVKVLPVPTTLLGMVDAAVGGKTGIDWNTGKNLVGAFYPPVGVAVDFRLLATLPPTQVRAGLAEALKCGFIRDSEILRLADAAGTTLVDVKSPQLHEVIRRAIKVKAEVVSADLYESGAREYLNFGHTLAHAIELAQDYRFAHGEAVAIGMVYAAHLGVLMRMTPPELPGQIVRRLEAVGLPVSYSAHRFEELLPKMLADKKVRGGVLRFVLLQGVGQPTVVSVQDTSILEQAACLTGIATQ
ncbi:3-dehydroquinate synthase [Mobiluncus mulieris]|nr:3-dehydroquinate synthase [Mobiluncus mulieris]MCV0001728.1 3-dehydroquinate synthase [Mobiluncus mulieris]